MDDQNFIFPIFSDKEDNDCNNTIDVEIHDCEISSESISKLYKNVYYKKIKFEVADDLLKKVIDQLIKNEENVDFDKLDKILQLYLLTSNFYHWLKDLIEKQRVELQHNISIQQHKIPIYDNSLTKHDCFRLFLLNILVKNDTKNTTKDLICCYMSVNSFTITKDILTNIKNINKFIFLIVYMKNHDHYDLCRVHSDNANINTNIDKFFVSHLDFNTYICTVASFLEDKKYINFIRKCNSHVIVDLLYDNIKNCTEFDDVVIETYNERHLQATISIFTKMFSENESQAEYLLKKLIIETQTKMLYNLFYNCCKNNDHDYIEACLVNANHIDKMDDEQMLKIANSSFFTLLTRKLDIYKKCLHKIAKNNEKMYDIVKLGLMIFKSNNKVNEIALQKFLFFVQVFPSTKNALFDLLQPIFEMIEANNNFANNNDLATKDYDGTKEISDNIKNVICDIVNEYRQDFRIYKYIKTLVDCVNPLFFQKCLFTDTANIDLITVAIIKHAVNENEQYKTSHNFWTKLLDYIAKIYNNNSYWNVMIRKQLKCLSLSHNNIINVTKSKKTKDGKNKFDDLFFINYIDDEMILKKLITELQKTDINYDTVNIILENSNKLSMYQSGLVFFDSRVEINETSPVFCLYAVYFQYLIDGLQTLVCFTDNDGYECSLCLENSKIILYTKIDECVEKQSLFENQPITKSIAVGFKYKNNVLKLYVYSTKHIIQIREFTTIIIGQNFKGIIQKVMWHEGYDYNANFFLQQPLAEFYQSFIAKLEKKMAFKHEKGVFLCHPSPYFLINNVDIKITNVIYNENVYFIENKQIKNTIFDIAQKDEKLMQTLNRHITKLLSNFQLSIHEN